MSVANRKDLLPLVCTLYVLGILAALLSPNPGLSVLPAILLFGAGWTPHTLEIFKPTNIKLTSVIFPDGRVRLESDREDAIEGYLVGQQWTTQWFSVLRFSNGDTIRKLVIRSTQQPGVDDYRRLIMWLRNDMCSNTTVRQVFDS